MRNYKLENDEVILYNSLVKVGEDSYNTKLTLTNKNIIFEQEKGVFKKKFKLVQKIEIDRIKMYKDKVQIKQNKSTISIQTIDKTISFTCDNMIEARKLIGYITSVKTGTNILERTTKKAGDVKKVLKAVGGVSTAAVGTFVTIKEVKNNGKELVQILKSFIGK